MYNWYHTGGEENKYLTPSDYKCHLIQHTTFFSRYILLLFQNWWLLHVLTKIIYIHTFNKKNLLHSVLPTHWRLTRNLYSRPYPITIPLRDSLCCEMVMGWCSTSDVCTSSHVHVSIHLSIHPSMYESIHICLVSESVTMVSDYTFIHVTSNTILHFTI